MKISIMKFPFLLLATVTLVVPLHVFATDSLGRLFLSPAQRLKLERVRELSQQPPTPVVEVMPEPEVINPLPPEDTGLPEIPVDEEPVLTEPLVLRGVVKRANGKNAAWINDTSTLDGDSVMQDIQLHESDIASDGVKLKLPDNVTEVTLKVGQAYEPEQNTDNTEETD